MNSINKPLKLLVMMAAFLPAISSCNKSTYKDYGFKYWNTNCMALNNLKTFVKEAVDSKNAHYIPKEDRIATFDMDGTLFGERAPIYIEWMMFDDYFETSKFKDKSITLKEKRLKKDGEDLPVAEQIMHEVTVPLTDVRTRIQYFMEHQKEQETHDVIEDTGTYTYKLDLEMQEAYAGALLFSDISVKNTYLPYVDSFLEKKSENYFTNLQYKDMFYKPMVEVVEYLQQNDFDVYIVSGTDRFMVREIVNIQNHKYFNIPSNKVIGMDVSLSSKSGDVIRGSELKYKNVKEVKVELIAQEIGKKPVLSFGNSSGDAPMHDFTLSNKNYNTMAFMVVADDTEREYGYTEEQLKERTKNWGSYNQFSMKNDFKTIYGDNVTKVTE